MVSTLLLGIDIGTSSTKALLMEEKGNVVASATQEYAFSTPQPLWVEADPRDWWEAVVHVIHELLAQEEVQAESIHGIGLSGQMHGLVVLDAQGDVIRPCILWNDQRTAAQCGQITEIFGLEKLIEITGNPVLPGFTAPKLVWLRENEPESYERITKILLPKDYIRYRLSGAFCSDVSDASGTSFLNVEQRAWSEEIISGLECTPQWFPKVTESQDISSQVSAEGAQATGLLEGIPIVGGAGDQAAQAVGCGVVQEGAISATLGTSGVVYAHSSSWRRDPRGRLHAFCSAVPGEWHLMGVMLSAGGAFQWYRQLMGEEKSYEDFIKEAQKIPVGAEGLTFLPYLSGERTPYPDPEARGCFLGLTHRHTQAHLTRSVLEGITYGMKDSLVLMQGLGINAKEVIVSGGGAKSAFWRQMMADVFASSVITVNVTEGAAYGAALLAGVGAEIFPSVQEACVSSIRETSKAEMSDAVDVYGRRHMVYQSLYPLLQPYFWNKENF